MAAEDQFGWGWGVEEVAFTYDTDDEDVSRQRATSIGKWPSFVTPGVGRILWSTTAMREDDDQRRDRLLEAVGGRM